MMPATLRRVSVQPKNTAKVLYKTVQLQMNGISL